MTDAWNDLREQVDALAGRFDGVELDYRQLPLAPLLRRLAQEWEPETSRIESERVPIRGRQATETKVHQVFQVEPRTQGAAPFHVETNSFANPGAGAGTYNHGMWFGWNAARYSGGTAKAGWQGVYMGFEDNYYDAGGDETFGVEWYVGYTTPDGATIGDADLRPFYCRVLESDTNTSDKEVIAWVDVGSGASGSFSVMGNVLNQEQLFIVHKSLGIFGRLPAYFTADAADAGGAGSLQIMPADGYAQMDLVAPNVGVGGAYGLVAFKVFDTYRWALAGTTGAFEIQDSTNAGRKHVELTPGASDTTAVTTLRSNLAVLGKFGANGTTPVAKQTLGAAATDPATTQTLANNLRSALIAIGLGQP